MNRRLDDLLKNSAAAVPDPAEYRRLNRAALRECMDSSPSTPGRSYPWALVAASVLILTLAGGFSTNLVSYDWELESLTDTTGMGEETVLHTDPYTGHTFNSSGPRREVEAWQQAFAANDGQLTHVTVLAYRGHECWIFHGDYLINGVEKSSALDNPPEYPCEDMPDQIAFYQNFYRDIRNRAKLLPPDAQSRIFAYDKHILIKSWTHEYPGFGPVTYSRGYPVD